MKYEETSTSQSMAIRFEDVVSGQFDAEDTQAATHLKRVLPPQPESPKLHKVLGVETPVFD